MIGQDKIIEGAPWMESADGVAVWQLACPECGETEIGPAQEGGEHGATVPAGRDGEGSPIGTDGSYTEFGLRCRAGHRFRLLVAAAKGAQYLGIVQAGAPAADSDIDVPGTLDPS
jgi:hypothetical protein